MAEDLTVSGAHPLGERSARIPDRLEESVPVDSFAGKVEVRWAPHEAVTPLRQLPLFEDFLKQADFFDPFSGSHRCSTLARTRRRCGTCGARCCSRSCPGPAARRMSMHTAQ